MCFQPAMSSSYFIFCELGWKKNPNISHIRTENSYFNILMCAWDLQLGFSTVTAVFTHLCHVIGITWTQWCRYSQGWRSGREPCQDKVPCFCVRELKAHQFCKEEGGKEENILCRVVLWVEGLLNHVWKGVMKQCGKELCFFQVRPKVIVVCWSILL